MWLAMAMRRQVLKGKINAAQSKLLEFQRQKQSLVEYSASIADGVVSHKEFATMPSEMSQRSLGYIFNTVPQAFMAANQRTDMYAQGLCSLQQSNGMVLNPGGMQNMSEQQLMMIRDDCFKSELEKMSKYESKKIEVEEKRIDQETLKLETQLKAMQAEFESLKEAQDKEIQNGAIKLA